jgi:hypothetical protein
LITTEQDPIDILATGLERRRNKQLALESISAVPLAAWSTDDLVAERMRVGAVLDQAPPDRAADLRALGESRREVALKIHEHEKSVAALQIRRRQWRQRRQPDYDLAAAETNLGHYQQQAERLDREIAALHASQHRRASHLAAHGADAAELDDINKAFAERLRQQTTRTVLDPPIYIVKLLGLRPHDPSTDRAWVRGVVEIERYRLDHGITDGRTASAPSPHWATSTPSMRGTVLAARSPTPERPSRHCRNRSATGPGGWKVHHWGSNSERGSRCSVEIMNARAEALRSELLALPEAERARLSIDLLDSLDDRPVAEDSAELDRIWAEETARRAAQIDSGAVKMDSWDDLTAKVAEARRTPWLATSDSTRWRQLRWSRRNSVTTNAAAPCTGPTAAKVRSYV